MVVAYALDSVFASFSTSEKILVPSLVSVMAVSLAFEMMAMGEGYF